MSTIEFAYDSTIEGWMRALELKDRQTEGHSIRLAELVISFAQEFGIEKEDLRQLRRGTLLHDIGKIGIPDTILHSTGPLTEAERIIMELHPQYGYEMISPISFLQPAAEIVYCHHEYWDGSGYPRGLKGKEIPQLARIVVVCNVWDALTSDQPYRKAWEKSDARNYIDLGSEKQFDPEIVEAFLQYIDDRF